MDQSTFTAFYNQTKIIREYKGTLSLYRQVELPYIFANQMNKYPEKVWITRGSLFMEPPIIFIPDDSASFGKGFEDIGEILDKIPHIRRGLNSVKLKHDHTPNANLSVGGMESVLVREQELLDRKNDPVTAIITGPEGALPVSLFKYFIQLDKHSQEGNFREAFAQYRLMKLLESQPRG